MGIDTRNPGIDDESALRHVWKTVFDGDDEDAFFRNLYNPEMCSAVYHNSTLSASGYLLPAGYIIHGETAAPCPASKTRAAPVPVAMIYAVATLPEFRGLGYGTAIVRDLISKGRAAGYPAIVLCPAEDGLFEYYAAHTEFRDWFYVSEHRSKKPAKNSGRSTLTEIQTGEYILLREDLLKGTPHIDIDPHLLAYQSLLCSEFGGGLFRADSDEGVACAVVELCSGNVVQVHELLGAKENTADDFSAIADLFPAEEYIIRTPAVSAAGSRDIPSRRFGMLAAPPGIINAASNAYPLPWYGLAFE